MEKKASEDPPASRQNPAASLLSRQKEVIRSPQREMEVKREDLPVGESPSGSPLFRLMKLVRETQCEMEVVKPVLDELEVMRLCCGFGMMSCVNPKDFDFDVVHAHEFDDDFARFLRYELLGNSNPKQVGFKGLIGKQEEVRTALVGMNACSHGILKSMNGNHEGIYCVKVDEDGKVPSLVVFSWIRDELFEPRCLRDTATFVLRFLTGLAPDIICCLSTSDMEQLKTAVLSSNEEQEEEDFSTYSVSFRVEKQVDQNDDTKCVATSSIPLDKLPAECSDLCLLKGSYPALSWQGVIHSTIRRDTFKRNFSWKTQETFPKWLKAESQQHRVELSSAVGRSPKLCECILREFDKWPEGRIIAFREERKQKEQAKYVAAVKSLNEELKKQREKLEQVSAILFQLRQDATPDSTLLEGKNTYEEFLQWLQLVFSRRIDEKFVAVLNSPTHFSEIGAKLYALYERSPEADLDEFIEMCATAKQQKISQAIAKCRGRYTAKAQPSADDKQQEVSWEGFLLKIAGPLAKLRGKWWIAVESGFAAAKEVRLKEIKGRQKHSDSELSKEERLIVENAFTQLQSELLAKDGLVLQVSATPRKKVVLCEISRESLAPSTDYQAVMKVNTASQGRTEYLGHILLDSNVNTLVTFTVKVRSILQVCVGKERMCVKLIQFPPLVFNDRRPPPAKETILRTFGKFASVCDYDAQDRIMTFICGTSMAIYKLDESFSRMEPMKTIDLGVRSTLTALPFTDALHLDNAVYVTDSSGYSQAIDMRNDQTSTVFRGYENVVDKPRQMMGLADNLVLGVLSMIPIGDGAYGGVLECSSRDDYRHLPILPLGVEFLSSQPHVHFVNDRLFVLDPLALKLYTFSVEVTVRSDSYRVRQVDKQTEYVEGEAKSVDCLRKQHWLYAFYHVFEKFPVLGLLEAGPANPVSVTIACSRDVYHSTLLEDCHDFLSLLMSDLMALNKPLHRLDLTKGLAVIDSFDGVKMQTTPLTSLLQTLITFLPIQVCRAEGNALTVLCDGVDQSAEQFEMDVEMESWGAADIAESIRFGLLSPLLSAWRGRCIVITSMGKQSTGKSYFLNHLTGSSFAIAGNRCTDGAWMTLRVLKDVLLVVLDFEGLGSFERTDQEDVFLSVLNASLSMFTVFRMEMRLDKDTDSLFTKFQKGTNLLKNDERLFQGKLYMSVKDVNPNDRDGVLTEFNKKIQILVTANREQNFLTDMYSGNLAINCSPPLGTYGYFNSLRHARQLINEIIEKQQGFSSGSSFHDCIRLVLAKISIFDWTAVDETSQRLQMNELCRKLPGVCRTGRLIPVDAQAKDLSVIELVMEPILLNDSALAMLRFEQLCEEYPEFVDCWTSVNQEISLDDWNDDEVDLGPALCTPGTIDMAMAHFTLQNLFQRYLALTEKGALEKITRRDYQNFDAMLLFLVRRRKTKVTLWLKQQLGPERFLEEWGQIQQTQVSSLESLFKRCLHGCAKCQLQCLQSACHSLDEEHDCGMTHKCRSLCEYCVQCYKPGKEIPHCAIEAGHEGMCNCGKGDHTCGAECSLVSASNCAKLCVLIGGHDGDHRCSVQLHLCGVSCSATNCGGKCILNAERQHTVHKCAETQCNHACEMEDCKERCSTANHFHDQPNLCATFASENGQNVEAIVAGHVSHMCSSRHACNALCEADGICSKTIEVSTCQFSGQRDTFEFVHRTMTGVRNKCAIVLVPGQTNHDGVAHSCVKLLSDGTQTVHSCDVRCAACAYYCDKPFDHDGDHSAAHGSMRNMHFVAQNKDLDWQGHKYTAGERGIAEMCNMYCSGAGRGHVHYMKCGQGNAETCVYAGNSRDQRRHCKTVLQPPPDREVDEVLHEKYWKTIGWEDPCGSAAERALFAKCPAMCVAPEHSATNASPSYCDLQAWHAAATPDESDECDRFSYVCGHRFTCSHTSVTGLQHHVFVLDCSGSMRGGPWQKLMQGYREYLRARMTRGSIHDIVSVVTFGDKGVIEFEGVKIENAVNRCIPFRGGGTFYSNGLSRANAIISRMNRKLYKPVLIFFTDGRPADRKKGPALATDIRNRFAMLGMETFVVGCGRVSDLGVGDLATRLGGEIHEAATAADLSTTFRSIAVSLGARAGLIHSG